MEVSLFLLALAGVALATPSFQEEKNGRPISSLTPLNIPSRYNLLLEQVTNVKADETLSAVDKQRKIGAIRQQLGRVMHLATSVPKELLFNRQSNPASESHRQQFMKEVDTILKSTVADDQQKKLGISLARAQFRQSLETADQGADRFRLARGEERVKQLGAYMSEDIKSAMKDVMKEISQSDAGRGMELGRDLKKGLHDLKKKFTDE